MKNFTPPAKPLKREIVMDKFIEIFNNEPHNNRGIKTINTGLNYNVPEITDEEFNAIKVRAELDGWNLYKFDDEHNTITYKIEPIKKD